MKKSHTWKAIFQSTVHFLDRHAVLLLILLGVLLRAWKLGSIPGGFNQDEASGLYDAWSVLHYGIDRNGFHMPMMFVSWGSSMHVLSYYASIPFLWLFDFAPLAVRMPPFLASVVSLPVFYMFVRRITDRSTALVALFLLVIAPWHFLIARWNHESAFLATFMLAGVTLFLLRRPLWAAVVFALALYVYGPALLLSPLLFVLILVTLLLRKSLPWREALGSASLFALLAQPMVLFLLINYFNVQTIDFSILSIPDLPSIPHYNVVTAMPGGIFTKIFQNLWTLWIFLIHQKSAIWNEVPGFGFLYLFSTGFFLVGAALFFLRRRSTISKEGYLLLALWVLACLLLAAVMPVNTNRINVLFYPLTFFVAFGLQALRQYRTVWVPLLFLYTVTAGCFFYAYFTTYAAKMSTAFYESFPEAITYAKESSEGTICIDTNVNMPYVYALIADQTDPNTYLDTVEYVDPKQEFRKVKSFGRFLFGSERCDGVMSNAYVVDRPVGEKIVWGKAFEIHQFTNFTVAIRLDAKTR